MRAAVLIDTGMSSGPHSDRVPAHPVPISVRSLENFGIGLIVGALENRSTCFQTWEKTALIRGLRT
jgi:hypothetical protein